MKMIAGLIGLTVFVWLSVTAAGRLDGRGSWPEPFFLIFSLIAISAAARMITHTRPVYSALYFVLVVLSSAGMFLMLEAEFMAFALIIVYAGAILITYMFVLMLAQQTSSPDGVTDQAEYDVVPREPAAAVVVGFILLAVFTNMIFGRSESIITTLEPVKTPEVASAEAWGELEAMPSRRDAALEDLIGDGRAVTSDYGTLVQIREDGTAFVDISRGDGTVRETVDLPDSMQPTNVERVGWALIWRYPVSLEVAGVILLMAMFGAVVLARRQIELGEQELHATAGMAHYAEDPTGDGGAA